MTQIHRIKKNKSQETRIANRGSRRVAYVRAIAHVIGDVLEPCLACQVVPELSLLPIRVAAAEVSGQSSIKRLFVFAHACVYAKKAGD